MNKRGPRIEPCGTPVNIYSQLCTKIIVYLNHLQPIT